METDIIPPSCCKIKSKNISLIVQHIFKELYPHTGKNKVLEIIFVSENEIRDYNKRYRKIARSTNVLTFIYSELDDYIPTLASVVLCIDVIKRRAKAHKRGINDELKHTLIHGILHAAGFDHHKLSQRKKMRALEDKYMKKFQSVVLI
ncbi:rRNA maturation RNase YbeY [candidate division WOR-3 bacterium]|nr:rRNA maturation RNase YbeY [candidate division WOR-3 bacterium]